MIRFTIASSFVPDTARFCSNAFHVQARIGVRYVVLATADQGRPGKPVLAASR